MGNSNLSLDALKSHLFETLEGVKNLSDPKASKCEQISIDQAKSIVDISGKIIDVFKVQVDALQTFSRLDDVASMRSLTSGIGIANKENVLEIENQ